MARFIIEEAEISTMEVRANVAVFVETRSRADNGTGIEVWALRVIPPFVSPDSPADATAETQIVVIVDDPNNKDTQQRIRNACHDRYRKFGKTIR